MLLGLVGFRESPNGYDTWPGKRSNSLRTGKLPLLVGKSTISMAIAQYFFSMPGNFRLPSLQINLPSFQIIC